MSLFDRFSLGEGFKRYFEVVAATTDELRNDVYRIRHDVYCEELGFEPVRPDGLESDQYDSHSTHCLLRSVSDSHDLVGCARMVTVNPADPDEPLPFERLCHATLDRSIVDPARLPRDKIGEISRLAVRARYRRRRGEEKVAVAIGDEDFGSQDNPRFPYIPIGLYLSMTALAKHLELEHVFVLTEPRLASHFAKLGLEITQIGGPVEHRGARIPSMFNTERTIRNMRFLLKPIWRVVEEEVERSLAKP
ncbi:MAG: PEP-CTERM/exosortase system-associated acyltransferase [Rhodocyclaceae bacterium]|nr:PEP-CTERM/exosortase system-associated acyltransferase [Rhodocyclaceae bacterium]